MRTIVLLVFVFLSGVCLGLLIASEHAAHEYPAHEHAGSGVYGMGIRAGTGVDADGQKIYTFEIVRVGKIPHYGQVLLGHGRATIYFSSEEEFKDVSSEVYGLLMKRVVRKIR